MYEVRNCGEKKNNKLENDDIEKCREESTLIFIMSFNLVNYKIDLILVYIYWKIREENTLIFISSFILVNYKIDLIYIYRHTCHNYTF